MTNTDTREDELKAELQAILDEFVLYRDDTPHSNEPTELSVFLRQCDFPDAMERLGEELLPLIDQYATTLAELNKGKEGNHE